MSQRIGRYEIQAEIGRGGFGRVYRGYDPAVGRVVAIKVLLPETTDPEFLTRFKMEATTAGNLHHPNLVTIHEFGEENGSQFLVMEYLEGEDLQHIIREKKQISLLDKVEIMQQVAAGLHCAHENNVIHRDVKPSNVMVLRDNAVKLMDFGIARLNRSDSTRMTKAGFLVGTLNYMSPEQFRDAEVDSLCDIWAFGVIYYEFLTGRFPFEGTSTPAILYSITAVDPPPPSTLVPDCPEALSQVIMKTLSKDRDLRYQSLQEFQLDVGPILLDLRKQRAAELIPEARALFEQQRGEDAQRLVRRVLDLDPMNAEARQLREKIQRLAQQQAVLPKIGALKKAGQEQLAQQRYAEAIQSFEAALRLDSANVEIQSLLEQARGSVGHYKKAQEFLEAATPMFERKDFSGAYELVRQALEVDPGNQRARELATRIQHASDTEDRRREVAQAVDSARALLRQSSFDEAIALLNDARARLHDPAEILAAIQEAEAARAAKAERERIERAVGEAGELLRQERVDEAENLLAPLLQANPNDAAIAAVVERCAAARRVIERREAVRRVAARTRSLQQDGELERAVALVQRALHEFDNDPALVSLLGEAEQLVVQRDNRRAIEETLRQARDLRNAGDMAGANKILIDAVRKYGDVPALSSLAKEIAADLRARENREAAHAIANEVRALTAKGDWKAALDKLRDALKKYPVEPELTALLDSVERGLGEQETRKKKEAILHSARDLEAKGKDAEALASLDEGLREFAADPELTAARAALAARAAERQRAGDISARAERISKAIDAGQFDAAKKDLDEAVRQLGDQPNLRRLAEELDLKRRMASLDATAKAVEQLIAKGNVAEARQRVEAALAEHPRDARLLRLQQSIDSEAVFLEALQRVEQQLSTRRLDLAETALRAAAGIKPGDDKINKLTQRIAKEREKLAGERAKTLKKAQDLTAKSSFDEAAALLGGLLDANPGDAGAVKALDELNAARGAHIKRQTYTTRIQELEAKRRADNPQAVKEGAAVLLAEFPNDAQARALLDWAEERLQALGVTSITPVAPSPGISTGVKAGLALGLLVAIGGGSLLLLRDPKNGNPAWSASTGKMAFQWRMGEGLPEPKQIALSSNGGAVSLKAASSEAWLTVDPGQTATPGQFSVAIAPTAMAPGDYTAMVTLDAAGAEPKSRQVEVSLKILPRAGQAATPQGNSISADLDLLTFEVRQGSTLSDSKLIRVRGNGVSRVSVATRGKGSWLRVSPAATTIPAAISVSVSATGMSPGPYQGEVIITAEGVSGVVHRVPVSLRVREADRPVSQAAPPPPTPREVPKEAPPPAPKETPKEAPPPPTPTGTYAGLRRGNVTWVGDLGPGQRITITKDGVASGGGNASGQLFPGDVPINVELRTPGVRLESAPSQADRFSRLVIVNSGSSSVSLVQIRWTVRD